MNSSQAAIKIREISLRLVHKARASHIASALSIADLLSVMVSDSRVFTIDKPGDPMRDRLLLSKGHACVSLYAAFYLKGFYDLDALFTYGDDYSVFMNHVSHKVPGVEVSTGALGHALPIACGKAFAAKLKGEAWQVFVIMSDGELQEGSNWEAMLFAGHHSLSNITICIDFNNLQSLTTTDETIGLRPLAQKFQAFGWSVYEIDGHDHDLIRRSLISSRSADKPTAIILNTIKGKGVSFMEQDVRWHYKSPSDDELQIALKELGVL